MKIGVLTHPLFGNYGGMLQAYALVATLRSHGFDAVYLSYLPAKPPSIRLSPLSFIRHKLNIRERLRTFLMYLMPLPSDFRLPSRPRLSIATSFQKQHIPCAWIGDNPANQLRQHQIDAVVVGSDQVWRGRYVRDLKSLPFFFLDFAPQEIRKRSIAYAASFGTDIWEGDTQETSTCSSLLQEFRAVSVRERSGVSICHAILNTDAIQMVDPTMLLNASDYENIINREKTYTPSRSYIGCYILDKNDTILKAIKGVASHYKLDTKNLHDNPTDKQRKNRFPVTVAQWLRLIRDSEFIITDSFHGCVFAIIFNKPFVCLGNKNRGNARFDSLLGTFKLQERILTDPLPSKIQEYLSSPIDWNKVNAIRESEQRKAFSFLLKNLSPLK